MPFFESNEDTRGFQADSWAQGAQGRVADQWAAFAVADAPDRAAAAEQQAQQAAQQQAAAQAAAQAQAAAEAQRQADEQARQQAEAATQQRAAQQAAADQWAGQASQQAASVASTQTDAASLAPPQMPQQATIDSSSPEAFIRSITPWAQQISQQTGIPAAAMIGMAANETGYGKFAAGNNLFGIKGTNGPAGSISSQTWEDYGSGPVTINANFKAYANPGQSFQDFADLVTTAPRYAAAKGQTTVEGFVQALKDGGYMTDPAYVGKISSIVQRFSGTINDALQGAGQAVGGAAQAVGGAAQQAANYVFPVQGYSGDVALHWGDVPGGSDLFAPRGTPVLAMRGGKVVEAGYNSIGGNSVLIQGDDGNQYYYAHFNEAPSVKVGQTVGTGTYLGPVGNTGDAAHTGTHLHIGIGPSILLGADKFGGTGGNFDAVGLLRRVLSGQGAQQATGTAAGPGAMAVPAGPGSQPAQPAQPQAQTMMQFIQQTQSRLGRDPTDTELGNFILSQPPEQTAASVGQPQPIQQPSSPFDIVGNIASGLGGAVSGAVSGVGNALGGLFGRGGPGGQPPQGPTETAPTAATSPFPGLPQLPTGLAPEGGGYGAVPAGGVNPLADLNGPPAPVGAPIIPPEGGGYGVAGLAPIDQTGLLGQAAIGAGGLVQQVQSPGTGNPLIDVPGVAASALGTTVHAIQHGLEAVSPLGGGATSIAGSDQMAQEFAARGGLQLQAQLQDLQSRRLSGEVGLEPQIQAVGAQLNAINQGITQGQPYAQAVEQAAQRNPNLPALQTAAGVASAGLATPLAAEGAPLVMRAIAETLQPGTNPAELTHQAFGLLGHADTAGPLTQDAVRSAFESFGQRWSVSAAQREADLAKIGDPRGFLERVRDNLATAGRGVLGQITGQTRMGIAADTPEIRQVVENAAPVSANADRFYHGTGADFPRPNQAKFDANGLFGPGYYLTDDPRVAGGIIAEGGEPRWASAPDVRRGEGWSAPLQRGDVIDAGYAQASARDDVGANVRAVDVPKSLNLFDAEAPATNQAIDEIAGTLASSGHAGGQMEDAFYRALPEDPTGADVYRALLNAREGSRGAVNQTLADAGFDGVRYSGGKRVPMRDEAGASIEHTAVVVFPQALGELTNATAGTRGGLLPDLTGESAVGRIAGRAAIGGISAGAQQAQQPGATPQDIALAALQGAALGAGREAFLRNLPAGARLSATLARAVEEQGGVRPPQDLSQVPTILERFGLTDRPVEGAAPLSDDDLLSHYQGLEHQYEANNVQIARLADQLHEARNPGVAPIRPQWAVGLPNEAVIKIANDHGVSPYREDWWEQAGLSQGSQEVSRLLSEGGYRGVGTRRLGGSQLQNAQAELDRLRAENQAITDHLDPLTAAEPGTLYRAPVQSAELPFAPPTDVVQSASREPTTAAGAPAFGPPTPVGRSETIAAATPADLGVRENPPRVGTETPAATPVNGTAGGSLPVEQIPEVQRVREAANPPPTVNPADNGIPPPPGEPPRPTSTDPGDFDANVRAAVEQEAREPGSFWQVLNAFHSGNVVMGPFTLGKVAANTMFQPVWNFGTQTGRDLLTLKPDRVMGRTIGAQQALVSIGSDFMDAFAQAMANRTTSSIPLVDHFLQAQHAVGGALHAGMQNVAAEAVRRMELGAAAGEQVAAQGGRGIEGLGKIADLIRDSSGLSDEAVFRAADMADRAGLRSPAGAVQQTVQNMLNVAANTPAGAVANFLLPVFRIGAQGTARLVEASPVGLVGTGIDVARGAAGFGPYAKGFSQYGEAVTPLADRLTANIAGTAITAFLASKSLDGTITGTGPDDPKARANLEAQGWRPKSVLVPGVGYVSWERLPEQLKGPLMLAGAYGDAVREHPDDPQGVAGRMAQEVATMFAQGAPGLSTLADIGGILKGDPYAVGYLVGGSAAGYIPGSALFGNVATAMDPLARKIPTTQGFGAAIGANIEQNIPGLREQLQPRVSTLGQPMPNPAAGLQGLLPWRTPGEIAPGTPGLQALRVLNANGVTLGAAPKTVTLGNGSRVDLTDDEQQQYEVDRAVLLDQMTAGLVSNQQFAAAPGAARKQVLDRLIRQADTVAGRQVVGAIAQGGDFASRLQGPKRLQEPTPAIRPPLALTELNSAAAPAQAPSRAALPLTSDLATLDPVQQEQLRRQLAGTP